MGLMKVSFNYIDCYSDAVFKTSHHVSFISLYSANNLSFLTKTTDSSIYRIRIAHNNRDEYYCENVQSAIVNMVDSNDRLFHALVFLTPSSYVCNLFFDNDISNILLKDGKKADFPDFVVDAVYDKIIEKTTFPFLKEWTVPFLRHMIADKYSYFYVTVNPDQLSQLKNHNHALVRYCDDNSPYKNLSILFFHLNDDNVRSFVHNSLRSKTISIPGTSASVFDNKQFPGDLRSYLNRFGGQITEKINTYYRPKFMPGVDKYSQSLCDFADYAAYRGLKLQEAQKTAAEAVARNLKANKTTFIIGEMGVGKTVMSQAAVYAHSNGKNGTTAAVLCPSHLTEKWKRELKTYYPCSEVYIINNLQSLHSIEHKIVDAKRRSNLFLIFGKDTVKYSPNLHPAFDINFKVKHGFHRYELRCPDCGEYINDFLTVFSLHEYVNNRGDERKACAKCGARFWAYPSQKNQWLYISDVGFIHRKYYNEIVKQISNEMNNPMRDKATVKKHIALTKFAKDNKVIDINNYLVPSLLYPVSQYIKRKLKHKIDYLIVDEMHQYKNSNSVQFATLKDLAAASKKIIGLTGTVLNGYADSIFYILYTLCPYTMQNNGYGYNKLKSFVQDYGIVKHYTSARSIDDCTYISINNKKHYPGISPAIFSNFILPNSVFVYLDDMIECLPSYQEIPVAIEPDEELFANYSEFVSEYLSSVKNVVNRYDAVVSLMQYLDDPTDLYAIWTKDGRTVYRSKALPDKIRNKEKGLLSIVKQEIGAGRRVLVYCHWTNSTDVLDKLSNMFAAEGIKACVLESSTTSASKREKWIKDKLTSDIQVLICNPSLVETGLDLIDFSTIVFYQLGLNIYTMRQASRRSWRLSQTEDVKVYYLYYAGTLQEVVINAMAAKQNASQIAEGRIAEGGLSSLEGDETLFNQLANSVIEGIKKTAGEVTLYKRVGSKDKLLVKKDNAFTLNTFKLYDEKCKRKSSGIDPNTVVWQILNASFAC